MRLCHIAKEVEVSQVQRDEVVSDELGAGGCVT